MSSIVLEFVGGVLDGATLRSDSENQTERERVSVYYSVSGDGQIGAKIATLPAHIENLPATTHLPFSQWMQVYEIVDRVENEETIHLRLERVRKLSKQNTK